jgi:hypothetical protein
MCLRIMIESKEQTYDTGEKEREENEEDFVHIWCLVSSFLSSVENWAEV